MTSSSFLPFLKTKSPIVPLISANGPLSLIFAIVPSSLFLCRRRFGLPGEQILPFVIIGDCQAVGNPVLFGCPFFIEGAHGWVGHCRRGIIIGLCHAFPVCFLCRAPLHIGHIRALGDNHVAFGGFFE